MNTPCHYVRLGRWTTLQILCVEILLASALLLLSGEAFAFCFAKAAQRYQISEPLLRAIALAESGNNASAFHANADGSIDIGVMQVNSSHLKRLADFGIEKSDLLQPCTNVMVGAWVLATNIQKYGLTWRAVGSYNAGDGPGRDAFRIRYVARVKPIFERLQKNAALQLEIANGSNDAEAAQ